MKFKDKDGNVFENLEEAHSAFCMGQKCIECPLYGDPMSDCIELRLLEPVVAADLMGYEVVEGKEGNMEKQRPRICEVLGVEVGEPFTADYEHRKYYALVVGDDGIIRETMGGGCNKIGRDALYYLINHPECINAKTNFTMEEKESDPNRGPGTQVKIKLDPGAKMPARAHEADAGYDLYARDTRIIPTKESEIFDTGVHIQLPPGTAGLLVSKSGLNVRHDLTSTGLIDAGYTGKIKVKLYNHGSYDYRVNDGDKISQLVIIPVRTPEFELVDKLEDTERGDNGFGSSGK